MFILNLATPERSIVAGRELEEVNVPAFAGTLGILPGHAPLMTTLVPGILSYKLQGEETKKVAISWGYCKVSAEGVNVLAEIAVRKDEINTTEAAQDLKTLENKLGNDSLDDHDWEKTQTEAAFKRAEIALTQGKS